jgi:DNA-binding IclR family transcriptional regulator
MQTNSSLDTVQTSSGYGTQTIQRAALLLRLLTYHNRTGLRLVDLAALSQMERPTVHRMLQGLIDESLVVQDQETRKYYLGSALYEMGLTASPKNHLRDICLPFLQWVAANTGVTVFLTVRSGFDGVCLDRKDGTSCSPLDTPDFDVGQRRPLGMGAGCMALLSALPDEVGDGIIAFNDQRKAFSRDPLTVRQIKERIAETRDKGYSSRVLNSQPVMAAVGLFIPDDTGRGPIGALSVRDLATNLQGRKKDQLVLILRRAVEEIGRAVHKKPHGAAIAASLSAEQKRPMFGVHSSAECLAAAARAGSS